MGFGMPTFGGEVMSNFLFMFRRLRWERRYRVLMSEAGDDSLQRLRSHAKNLEEYCSRWLGFCRLEDVTPDSLIDSGLFVVLEAASRVANRDVATVADRSDQHLVETWRRYWNCLLTVRKCPPDLKQRADQLYKELLGFVVLPA